MTKRPPLLILLIVVVACFALGLINVFLGNSNGPPTPSADATDSQTMAAPSPTEGDSTVQILILGVDQFTKPDPKLRAVWMATYTSQGQEVYIFGFPLDTPGEGRDLLADVYSWSPEAGLHPEFIKTLGRKMEIEPDLIAIMDDHGFSTLIDYLGGVTINNIAFNGRDLLSLQQSFWAQPTPLLQTQSSIIKAMVPRAAEMETPFEVTPLLKLVPEHAYISLDPNQVFSLLAPILPLNPDNVHVVKLWQDTP